MRGAGAISQNFPPFLWNEQREQAAVLLAEDALSDEQIAEKVGITRRQLTNWKQQPDFTSRIAGLVADFRAAVKGRGIADRQNRVDAQNDRWDRMRQVIEARASDGTMVAVPGGTTGLLVRTYRLLGRGEEASLVEEYAVDTGLLKELREHEKLAAQELGQWTEKQEITGEQLVRIYVRDASDDG